MNAGRGLFRDAAPLLRDLVPVLGIFRVHLLQQVLDHLLFVVGRGSVDPAVAVFQFIAFVDQQGHIAAVVHYQLRTLALSVIEGLGGAPPVLFERLALPGKHRNACRRDRGCGMVLGGKDVAAGPAHLAAQFHQGLDQHRGLNGHVQGAGDAHAGKRLVRGILAADGHKSGHLVLGNGNLFAAPVGQGEVSHLVSGSGGGAVDRCW